MNETARAAFIISQSVLLSARIAAMQAANLDYAARTGSGVAYDETGFNAVIREFDTTLAWNSCIAYLRGD
jgi:hypothetical protein